MTATLSTSAPKHGPVLAAVDLRESSQLVIEQAHQLALERDAELVVLHVVDLPGGLPMHTFQAEQNSQDIVALLGIEHAAAQQLAEQVLSCCPRNPEDFQTIIDVGEPPTCILRHATAIGASVIVVGDRHRSGFSRLFRGSVAMKIVRSAQCSVLLARPIAEGMSGVLAATDLSELSAPVVRAAATLARARDTQLALLHALDTQLDPTTGLSPLGPVPLMATEAQVDDLKSSADIVLHSLLELSEVPGGTIVRNGPAADIIIDSAVRGSFALVVLGTHDLKGLTRLAVGSVAETVARDAICSVFVSRAAEPLIDDQRPQEYAQVG